MKREKLKICFFGNVESIHMVKWARYFSEKSHEVHLLSYLPQGSISSSKDYNLAGIKLHLIKKVFPITIWPFDTLVNLPPAILRTKKIIKEINPDIIHAHYVTSYGTLSALLKFHPFLITAWGSDILIAPKNSFFTKWSVKYTLKKADFITCDAEHMKEAIMKLGAPSPKIKIINFGIDTQKFSPSGKDINLIEELGISNSKTVISLRSLEPIYNIETLIQTASSVTKEFPEAKFIIAGGGSQEKELKKLAKDLEILESFRFVGKIPNEELPKYLRIADVYVSTSLSDGGISASTAEAMACGLPVVITDTGENKKWIEDGKDGFIIPIKNPQILAEKIIYLLQSENERKKFGEKGRKIIEERNDYYKEMEKMEEIYYELLNKSRL